MAGAQPKNVWGPQRWHQLHSRAIAYPQSPTVDDMVREHAWLWGFLRQLPCAECRAHATAYARDHPPAFTGSDRYQTWAWRFHNAVNRRLGKPLMTAEEYNEAYAEEIRRTYWRYL